MNDHPLDSAVTFLADFLFAVPADVTGLYVLVSVESKQQRLFISHVIDITDK